jgi:hypothetical protein
MPGQPCRDLAEVLRDEMVMKDKIKDLLCDAPMTIPELAEALERPSHEVMLWVMAMWRYGTVVELKKERTDEYFQYEMSADQTCGENNR